MVAPFPLLKLLLLGVRQVSKPIAARVRAAAAGSDTFRGFTISIGRALNRMTVQITRASEGKIPLAHIRELDEAAAVERGADFLSEMVIYGVAGATVTYEFTHQEKLKQQQKEAAAAAAAAEAEARRTHEAGQEEELHHLRANALQLRRRMLQLEEHVWQLRTEQVAAARRGWLSSWGWGRAPAVPGRPSAADFETDFVS